MTLIFITYWVFSNVLKLQNHPNLCFILICFSLVVHIYDEGLCYIFPFLSSCGGQWQRGFGGCLTCSQGQPTTGTKLLPIIDIDLVGMNHGKKTAEDYCVERSRAGIVLLQTFEISEYSHCVLQQTKALSKLFLTKESGQKREKRPKLHF